MTPTRRFAPTSPFEGEVEQAAHSATSPKLRTRGSLFPPPERGRERVGVMRQ
jgi:hypothetical protein